MQDTTTKVFQVISSKDTITYTVDKQIVDHFIKEKPADNSHLFDILLPVLAALEQDIPVIVIEDEQNLMDNDLDDLPWKPGKFFRAKNYLEVVGYINCLKTGIMPDNLIRPINKTKQLYS